MKLAFFDAKQYDRDSFKEANKSGHDIKFIESRLTIDSVEYAKGTEGVVAFVNCEGTKEVLESLAKLGIKYWFERSAGYNNVDLKTAAELGIKVYRVPSYSPEAISEFAWTLLMALNRNIHIAHFRTSIDKNFTLNGLQGETIHGTTVGVIGAGRIGQGFIKIAKGLGTKVIVYDDYAKNNSPEIAKELGFEFVDKETLFKESDFISLHCILNDDTKYIVNKETISLMKKRAIIINTSRGELIHTTDLLDALDTRRIRGAGLDVFEKEKGIFFYDKSNDLLPDSDLVRLRAHRNVIFTAHQAWFTNLALKQIAEVTIQNVDAANNNNFEKALEIQEDGRVKNG